MTATSLCRQVSLCFPGRGDEFRKAWLDGDGRSHRDACRPSAVEKPGAAGCPIRGGEDRLAKFGLADSRLCRATTIQSSIDNRCTQGAPARVHHVSDVHQPGPRRRQLGVPEPKVARWAQLELCRNCSTEPKADRSIIVFP
jgi:hypothetical protein